MSTLKEKGMYKKSFAEFLAEKHPDVMLLDWQVEVLNVFLGQPPAAGKTFLVRLLDEYDAYAS